MRIGGWRALALFWAGIIALLVGVYVVLAVLGPPRRAVPATGGRAAAAPRVASVPRVPPPSAAPATSSHPVLAVAATAGAQKSRPIAEPDPTMLEPAPDYPGAMLPRTGPGGRRPSQVYASASGSGAPSPKVGLIVAGFGLNDADSAAAVAQLPVGVDFAVSAYAATPDPLLEAARNAGHEYLMSLPMEPRGYPASDEGPHELLTDASAAENVLNLEWTLSRVGGYFAVTGASDGQRGEHYAGSPGLMAGVGDELSRRGLLYIDPRPPGDAAERPIGRGVDVVIDDPEGADNFRSKLAELEQAARQHGTAVGLVGRCSPAAIANCGMDRRPRRARAGFGSGQPSDTAGRCALSDARTSLPYRANVGAVLFNRAGLVFVGRRALRAGRGIEQPWQLPQGGIDDGESPEAAVLRELAEETGIGQVTLLGEHDTWLTYDLPPELVGSAFGGRYRGQRQRWFALRFDGEDRDIRLDAHGEPEFDAWRWVELAALPDLAVPFKRPIYQVIAEAFAAYMPREAEA